VDRTMPVVVIVVVVALVFVGLAFAWRARRRRQAELPALATPPASLGAPVLVDDVFYVATTVAEHPTDRIAVHGLGFRSRAGVVVIPEGVVLSIAGEPDAFIPREAISGIGRATWTIDRVVGRDGLAFVRWALGDTVVDTYLKSSDPDALVAALTTLTPATKEAS
jgi:hypothetical protein